MVVHPAEISKAFLEAVDVRGRIKLDSASGVYTNLHVVGKTRRLVVERVPLMKLLKDLPVAAAFRQKREDLFSPHVFRRHGLPMLSASPNVSGVGSTPIVMPLWASDGDVLHGEGGAASPVRGLADVLRPPVAGAASG